MTIQSPPDQPGPSVGKARGRSLTGRVRRRVDKAGAAVPSWLGRQRQRIVPVDLAMSFYERDRDQFAAVLGAAIALRLFLFIVPATAALVGLFLFAVGHEGVDSALEQTGVTGTLAAQVEQATELSRSTGLAVFAGGLYLSVWAGRSLTKVLGACSALAWRLSGRDSRATLRAVGAVTALVLLMLIVTALLNRLRAHFGFAGNTASWLAAAAVFAAVWFAISMALPRRTVDPGALLPGAALVSVAMTALQWFMQFYLPGRISRASELVGSLGLAVAMLGYAFLVGRVMAASFIVDAVVWERLGSVSGLFFSLPVLRRLPARFASVARFFDLEDQGAGGRGGSDNST